jgi:uncharacterized protein YpmB
MNGLSLQNPRQLMETSIQRLELYSILMIRLKNVSKFEYTYDENGKKLTESYYEYVDGNWVKKR